jgi:hypothetical protein
MKVSLRSRLKVKDLPYWLDFLSIQKTLPILLDIRLFLRNLIKLNLIDLLKRLETLFQKRENLVIERIPEVRAREDLEEKSLREIRLRIMGRKKTRKMTLSQEEITIEIERIITRIEKDLRNRMLQRRTNDSNELYIFYF